MSIRKGSRTIASSVPVTEWGSIDGTLADQADIKSALDSKAPTYSPTFTGTPIAPTAPIDTSNNQIATTKYVQDALLNAEANLPEQSGNAGKFLTTNGQVPSWANIPAEIPSQSGQSGKFLTTNGTSVSWGTVDLSGKRSVISNASRVYTTDNNGNQSEHYYSNAPYNNAIAVFDGSAHLKSSSPSADNDVATKKYVDDNAVKKTGDEIISGIKTFSTGDGGISVKLKSTTIDKTVNPESNKYIYMDCLDKNNVRLGVVGSIQFPNGLYGSYLQAGNEGQIRILTDGTNVSTYAPTPSSVTDNTTKIATTEWVINVLKALYPVGSLYMGTQNSCPLSAFFGTWELVSAGNALWTGNGTSGSGTTSNENYANAPANTTIAAGLPNHNHTVGDIPKGQIDGNKDMFAGGNNDVTWKSVTSSLASASNQVYGKSSTVQPPAYVVNVWRRTA